LMKTNPDLLIDKLYDLTEILNYSNSWIIINQMNLMFKRWGIILKYLFRRDFFLDKPEIKFYFGSQN
jgi:hypothetical protein